MLWFGCKDTATISLLTTTAKVSIIIFKIVTIAALVLVLDLR